MALTLSTPKEITPTTEVNNDYRNLSEREIKFLEVLMEEARGDLAVAKRLAGYPTQQPLSTIVKRLRKEIVEQVELYMAQNAPLAVFELIKIITEPTPPLGAKEKLAAAKEILDRAGIVKTERKEVNHTGGVALLPQKN